MTAPQPAATFNADFSRQTDLFNPARFAETVTVIGCGSIGASVLPVLVTMGVTRFELFDPDSTEPHNTPASLAFRPDDAYRPKVEVLEGFLRAYGATDVTTHARNFTNTDVPAGSVVISGVDSMTARQEIWEGIQVAPEVQLYLDGRIGGEGWHLLAVRPEDAEWYEKRWLFGDERVETLPCAARNVAYVPAALAGEIAAYLARFSRDEDLPHHVQRRMGTDFFQVVEG